ncbi:MAG: hypothetical protein JW727_07005 [Candidatus Aenigmarchaeota archaeon]|nr:hypothetical protein [Candidatus Aenigmarchaeota archaeon]
MEKRSSNILLAIAILAATICSPALAVDWNDTETANVSITISTKTMVNIDPYLLTWNALEPGSIGNYSNEANGYFAIQVENIGSHNITYIWFNASYPTARPFATASAQNYDAGNFIVIAREPAGGANSSNCNDLNKYSDFKFPNLVEYPEVRALVYVKDDAGNMPPQNRDYGRFRFADEEYFWMISNATDCGGGSFMIGNNAHTEATTGTVDFQAANHVTVSLNAAGEDGWCYGTVGAGHNLTGYGVLVQNATSGATRKVMLVWWNKDAINSGSVGTYFWNTTNDGPIVPGNSTAACIKAYVPYGVNEGTVKEGVITVFASSA